jgi:hypothetical protein
MGGRGARSGSGYDFWSFGGGFAEDEDGMSSANTPLNLLQRVDLELAHRLPDAPPELDDLARGRGLPQVPMVGQADWVAGVLGLRGLQIRPEEVEAIVAGGKTHFETEPHECVLVTGMSRVYDRIVGGTSAPDGWTLVEMFKDLTKGVARFRNNSVRRDLPWDAILFVDYPASEKVSACLDAFHRENCFTDLVACFERMHPVRQAFRVLWLFARIAPFPDFNLSMAWVAMNLYLVDSGYPMLVPQEQDRERLYRVIGGPVPIRIVAFESRLLETLQTG